MIKIAYLIDTISCETAGTQKQLLEIIRRLDRDSFSPLLICLWESEWMRENTLPCPCTTLGYQGFVKTSFPRVIKKLAHLVREEKIQIIQTFFEDSIFVAFFAGLILNPSPILLSSRRDMGLGKESQPWYHGLYAMILPLVNRRFAGIIANSEQIKLYVAERERTSQKKIKVIYNGISIPKQPSCPPALLVKQNRTVWLGVIASLTPVKRHDLLIRAMAELRKKISSMDFKVVLLGDGGEQEHLKKMVDEMCLGDYVFFEGAVKDVPAYLYNIDIGILCSDREGLSNAIMEYMACGVPVVATAVGGNVELVDRTNGILVPPGDHLALADALEQLLRNPELRRTLGKEGKRKILENFSWDKSMHELEHYYHSLPEVQL